MTQYVLEPTVVPPTLEIRVGRKLRSELRDRGSLLDILHLLAGQEHERQ